MFGERGSTYGDFKKPKTMGSGGQRAPSLVGGAGGAAIHLNVTDTFVFDGSVSMDGTRGSSCVGQGCVASAAGSGGSVYITTPTFAGSGTITTNGGQANRG